MAEVVLRDVRKLYDSVEAVAGVSLSIADGEFVVLVGPSGCGKSTLLRLIAGLEDPNAGEIAIGGRVVNDVHPKDRDIAMVFQNYALYPHMTVEQNMSFALRLRRVGREEIRRRVDETARMLGIEGLLKRRPRQLSGGQRQRVAVGRAIVREPKAFLFDEPLSNLDAKLRVTTRGELKALHQRLRTTTVYVTHDQEEAMTLGDRIVVLAGGRVRQEGPPLEVYQRPADRFVASFIGTPPMNFVEGRLEREGGGMVFASGVEVRVPVAAGHQETLGAALGSGVSREVVLGCRPQGVRLGEGAGSVGARVEVVELLGDEMDLSCRMGDGTRLSCRAPARAGVSPGQQVRLTIEAERAHYFEPGEFGVSLVRGRA